MCGWFSAGFANVSLLTGNSGQHSQQHDVSRLEALPRLREGVPRMRERLQQSVAGPVQDHHSMRQYRRVWSAELHYVVQREAGVDSEYGNYVQVRVYILLACLVACLLACFHICEESCDFIQILVVKLLSSQLYNASQ
jgi:hypothetical protein